MLVHVFIVWHVEKNSGHAERDFEAHGVFPSKKMFLCTLLKTVVPVFLVVGV